MANPPMNHALCPCCGTEFGYDDCTLSHELLRKEWLKGGPEWFSPNTPKPNSWNWYTQLYNAGLVPLTLVVGSDGEAIPARWLPVIEQNPRPYSMKVA